MSTILVVDDNPATLNLILGVLSADYKVYCVDSAQTAMEFLQKQRPDLILLDIEMPAMNGIELLCVIKADPTLSNIPVLFLTVTMDTAVEATVYKLGAADYIRKPINDVVLSARVKTHLELQSYRAILGIK